MASKWFWPGTIIAYFLFHTIYRTVMGGSLGLDEAQIMLDAQDFRLGYGPQLPLYAWLQRIVFLITGSNLFSLALVKNALLCGLVLTLFYVLRTKYPPQTAGLVAVSLLLLPQISWENQRALTHSVLVNFSAVVTFAVIWCIARRPSIAGYVALGLAFAIGGLAKYNYYLLPVAAFLAASTLPQIRKVFWTPKIVISLVIAAGLLFFPIQWVVENPDQSFASARKFKIPQTRDTTLTAFLGIKAVFVSTFGFVLLMLVVSGLLLGVYKTPVVRENSNLGKMIWRMVGIGTLLVLLFVLMSGTTNVKERWLQPLLIFSAPAMVLWLVARLSDKGVRRLAQVYFALVLLIIIGLPVHNLHGRAYRAAPFDKVTEEIHSQLPAGTTLIAPTWVAGNLFYFSPDTPIINGDFPKSPPLPTASTALVWRGDELAEGKKYLQSRFPELTRWQLTEHMVLIHPHRFSQDEFVVSVARIIQVEE